jgi:hypothetical protein
MLRRAVTLMMEAVSTVGQFLQDYSLSPDSKTMRDVNLGVACPRIELRTSCHTSFQNILFVITMGDQA